MTPTGFCAQAALDTARGLRPFPSDLAEPWSSTALPVRPFSNGLGSETVIVLR